MGAFGRASLRDHLWKEAVIVLEKTVGLVAFYDFTFVEDLEREIYFIICIFKCLLYIFKMPLMGKVDLRKKGKWLNGSSHSTISPSLRTYQMNKMFKFNFQMWFIMNNLWLTFREALTCTILERNIFLEAHTCLSYSVLLFLICSL